MKQFLIAVLIVFLVGVGAFAYRYAKERPVVIGTPSGGQACTADAKVCPDGTSVGRSGPDCTFAACPPPNVENDALGIIYAIPSGLSNDTSAVGTDPTLYAVYTAAATTTGSGQNSISIYKFEIPAGKTANDVILANTVHGASGLPAKSMSEFSPIITNGHTYQSFRVENFEGIVHTEYYLARTNDVLRFDVTDRAVGNWTDPKLNVSTLPAHAALLKLLSTIQITKS